MRPAIVLSSQTAALGVVRALGCMGVPVAVVNYDEQDFAHYSCFVTCRLRAPHPETSEAEFIGFLLECGNRFPGAVLIPASDESLVAVSRHKQLLESRFLVACTSWEITRLFIDKQFTYALAETCGVPAPRTLVPHSLVEAVSNAKELGLPCLVKPCQSHLYYERFHRKMVMASSLGQIEEAFCMAMDAGLEVMLQEIIPGDDHEVVNYNTYVCKGQFLPEFTAIHERNAPPWFGSPRVAHSRRIPEVVEPGRRILSKLGFEGYACTEFKRDRRDGTYKLMEINGRHNLSTMLAVTCGINFPWLHYLHLGEGIVPQVSTYREGVYWIDLIRDLGYSGMFLTKERYSLADYLRPYIKSHVFAILDRRDLKPFLKRSLSITCKATRNIFGRAATKSLSPHEKSVLARSAFLKGEGQ